MFQSELHSSTLPPPSLTFTKQATRHIPLKRRVCSLVKPDNYLRTSIDISSLPLGGTFSKFQAQVLTIKAVGTLL
jgi:hypothetical protein